MNRVISIIILAAIAGGCFERIPDNVEARGTAQETHGALEFNRIDLVDNGYDWNRTASEISGDAYIHICQESRNCAESSSYNVVVQLLSEESLGEARVDFIYAGFPATTPATGVLQAGAVFVHGRSLVVHEFSPES